VSVDPEPFGPLPAPRIEDDEILIRVWEERDLAAVATALADPEIVRRNRLPQPFDTRAWLAAMPDRRRRGEALRLLVLDAGDGELLGGLALFRFDFERRSAELGYWLAAAARGRGVAGRAVALLCDWAFAELGLRRVEAETDADNLPSRRLLERSGFVLAEGGRGGRQTSGQARYRLQAPGGLES
jgi:RimJ/RimL family protein N-acetyltransferase